MNKKIIMFSVFYIALLLILSTVIAGVNTSEKLSNKILRFHILANSDSQDDQELKLKVRDQVLQYSALIYNDCESLDDALEITESNKRNIEIIANDVISQNGYDYKAKVKLTKEYYNTRKYDNFILPAGMYDSLKITIGNAEGHNWWCVMFPTVCLSGCTSDFDKYLTDEEKDLIFNDKYVVKFKIIEIYEKLKYIIKKEA